MSLWSVLEPLSTTVDAGSSASIALRVRNTGDIVEEYHIDVVGDPALWCTIEPSSVRLYPGTTTTVRLTFSPPRNSDSAAGPHPFGVRVTPVETPEAVMVPEGNVTITPFIDVRAELLPVTVRGWRRAKPRLVVDNYGNTTATAAVVADGQGNRLDFDIRNPAIQIPPGRANFSLLRLRPDRTLWLGQKVNHPYTTTLQLSGSEPVAARGNFLQTALLPRWVARLFAVLAAFLAVFAGLWFAVHPSVSTATTAQSTPAAALATISVPPSTAPPSPSASPSPSVSPSTAPATTQGAAAPKTSTSSAPKVTVPPPVAYWKLNDASGLSASDTEGNNPAALTNVGWCSSGAPSFGNCAIFNGTSSQAVSANNVLNTSPSQSFTVTADVDMNPDPSNNIETMVSQDSNAGGNDLADSSGFFLQYLPADGTWAFSRPGFQCAGTTQAVFNKWTTVTGVYNSATTSLVIYVGANKENTCRLPPADPPMASGGSVVIGRAQWFGSDLNWFNGELNDVTVYNQALDSAQVAKAIKTYQ